MEEKQCSSCKENLPIGFFWKKKDTKDGYTNYCIPCMKSKKSLNSYLKPISLNGEIWKQMVGYEDIYQVSNMGRIKSNKRSIIHHGTTTILPEIIMRQHSTSKGYLSFRACVNYKTKLILVHVAVAEAFLKKPSEKSDVNHIDGDKSNNHENNLEWCTRSENLKHAYKLGLKEKADWVPIPIHGINEYGKRISFLSLKEAYKNGFVPISIKKCANGKTKSYKGYKWGYGE